MKFILGHGARLRRSVPPSGKDSRDRLHGMVNFRNGVIAGEADAQPCAAHVRDDPRPAPGARGSTRPAACRSRGNGRARPFPSASPGMRRAVGQCAQRPHP